jgi:hypothetical protein
MFVCIRNDKKITEIFSYSFFPVVNKEDNSFEKKKDPSSGQFVNPVDDQNKTISQAKAKVLQNVDTFFYVGTEVWLD